MFKYRLLFGLVLTASIGCSSSPDIGVCTSEGLHDPTFDIQGVRTVGFLPLYWTRFAKQEWLDNYDYLLEKHVFQCFKEELERRGHAVSYLSPQDLEDHDERALQEALDRRAPGQGHMFPAARCKVGFRDSVEHYPDLLLRVLLRSQTSRRRTHGFDLTIDSCLYTGSPRYNTPVWRASVTKTSPELNLAEQARSMITHLFAEEFPATMCARQKRAE
jgi:hypothetical protein